ncbi:MAG: vanadium-dependent haloperoxidase [Planctomycetales bacterium]|nr:vanadium-dependent haloperoxidase [Planctomycetales bacterium]MCA9167020.1 vanadium-dependent haloperoxidase [Planctomycetales bacterium]
MTRSFVAHILWGLGTLWSLDLMTTHGYAQQSVARQWNELLLDAIRVDTPRPTVHARNLFHLSAGMYDAWAAYDQTALGYFDREKISQVPADLNAARNEAISFAAYRLLTNRFAKSPGAAISLPAFRAEMLSLGYDPDLELMTGDSPAAVGNRIAANILQQGLLDGSNEIGNYSDNSGYQTVNPPLDVSQSGTTLLDKNRWQPLLINGVTQKFLTPEWGYVKGFGLFDPVKGLPIDAGMPPQLDGVGDEQFRAAVVELIRYSSWLDASDGVAIDISPASRGNGSLGANDGVGYSMNPITQQSYAPNVVPRGDYGRVLAEFWADGPKSETPPGHWNVIFNNVSDSPLLEKRIGGVGALVDNLEWDVKSYFALNGAIHNAAIVAWGNKEAYDYVRPISMIRYMGGRGQSTDPSLPSYDPDGLPLVDDLIELITPTTTQPGGRHEQLAGHEGAIALKAWRGAPDSPDATSGVGWILAADWMPYQAEGFVTPGFAAYVSGHSTFSRAGAEILTELTGSEYFPGGLGEYELPAGDYLKFEDGPSQTITLQWAKYYDAADEAGLSRLYGGIHVSADDFQGRIAGSLVGREAYLLASQYYAGVPEPMSASMLAPAFLCLVALKRRVCRA